jgi:hypothetical protein
MILQPAVSLTDYALALEGGVLAALLWRKPESALRQWFVLFFASIAIAAALGGTVHGFIPDEATFAYAALWRATLITIGVVALAAAMAGANSGWSRMLRKIVAVVVAMGFAIYCVAVLFFTQEYLVAIIVYLPATLFLLISFLAAYLRAAGQERGRILLGAVGMLLTFAAAGVQQSTASVAHLDHNAIYHLIQAGALLLIYIGATGVVRQRDEHSDTLR